MDIVLLEEVQAYIKVHAFRKKTREAPGYEIKAAIHKKEEWERHE